MNKTTAILSAFALLAAVACSEERIKMPWEDDLNNKQEQEKPEDPDDPAPQMPEAKTGETLPGWVEGCLDIHLINSGRGECIFHILPDGTTLLVDAGETVAGTTSVPQKPDASVRPYMVDARYIRHFLPEGKTTIDWCAPSHFHIDHIGSDNEDFEISPNGYRLSGLLALYDEVAYDRVLDMGYPTYGADTTIPEMDGQLAGDWEKFVKWAVANKNMSADRFRVGEEQIVLVNDREQYADFRIFNICANGYVWKLDAATGQGVVNNTKAAKGNPASCGFHLTYGKFDYITCGDLTSSPQNSVAYYYRDFMTPGSLDVFKAHHHLSANAWGTQMQNCEFSPRVILNQSFTSTQPDPGLIGYIVNGNFATHPYTWTNDIFSTNVHPDALSANASLFGRIAGCNGHVVVRVAPGGGEYYVYMLDDTDFDYKVTSIHGPYTSK